MTPSAQLPEPNLAGYGQAQIGFAASAWPLRAAEELRSARIFHALKCAARASHLDSAWVTRFAVAVGDEVRHAKLCTDVGARLGAPAPHHDATLVRKRLASLPLPLDRAAALLLAEVAIGETISTSQFRVGRHCAREPLTRAALELILRDEVGHARLGWDALAALWPAIPDAERDALVTETRRALAACEQQIAVPALQRLEQGEPFNPEWAALGVVPPEQRVEAFYDAVEGQVVPRLARLGIDGQQAWSTRYRASGV